MRLNLLGQQKHDQGGNDRPGKEVGGEEREDHSFGERNEQVPRYAREKKHWNKYDADADRGDECRHGNFLGGIEYGLPEVLAHGDIALHVLNFDRRIVYQNPDRERQPSERHDVDGLS